MGGHINNTRYRFFRKIIHQKIIIYPHHSYSIAIAVVESGERTFRVVFQHNSIGILGAGGTMLLLLYLLLLALLLYEQIFNSIYIMVIELY